MPDKPSITKPKHVPKKFTAKSKAKAVTATSKKSIPKNVHEVSTQPPEMSTAYHKARRSYGLLCGLLIAWELIGIRLGDAPLKGYDVSLKSPQATPFVLIALILYFAFRFTIEWYQCSPERRALSSSKLDFIFAQLLGMLSIGLYLIQRIFGIQVANKLTVIHFMPFFTINFFMSFLIMHIYFTHKKKYFGLNRKLQICFVLLLFILLIYLDWSFIQWDALVNQVAFIFGIKRWHVGLFCLLGILMAIILNIIIKLLKIFILKTEKQIKND